jgi:hypothetical protein
VSKGCCDEQLITLAYESWLSIYIIINITITTTLVISTTTYINRTYIIIYVRFMDVNPFLVSKTQVLKDT